MGLRTQGFGSSIGMLVVVASQSTSKLSLIARPPSPLPSNKKISLGLAI